jgi:hypothetical protein
MKPPITRNKAHLEKKNQKEKVNLLRYLEEQFLPLFNNVVLLKFNFKLDVFFFHIIWFQGKFIFFGKKAALNPLKTKIVYKQILKVELESKKK